MDFMEMLAVRESCRSYQDKPVSREDLLKIVEAARLAPSGCNAQPWKFVIVDDAEAKKKLGDALTVKDGLTGCPWHAEVPAFIVAVEQPAKLMPAAQKYFNDSQRFAQGDIGMAVMNMCYEAVELGLSTCILGMCDQKKMEQYFGIPAGHEVRMILAVGYAAEDTKPRNKMRKPMEEICSFNQW